MRVIFMGTPDFGVPCLKSIYDSGHQVVAIFTQPDKPKGRGLALTPPPVKVAAIELGIPVFQPTSVRGEEMETQIKGLEPDVIVVVAYSKLIPENILNLPKHGCVNIHASLLPKYRGAGPIQWSIINGDSETGVTTMQMAKGMDTGDIIDQQSTKVDENETAGDLFSRLQYIGGDLIVKTLNSLEDGTATRTPQDESAATHAPKVDRTTGILNFKTSPKQLHDLVRGLTPWPAAYTYLGGKKIKILSTKPVYDLSGKVGKLLTIKRLIIGCDGGGIELTKVVPPGKKTMSGEDFLLGIQNKDDIYFDIK